MRGHFPHLPLRQNSSKRRSNLPAGRNRRKYYILSISREIKVQSFSSFFARLTMFSTVNPNFSKRTLAGAEAPKWSIPITSPLSPTYLYHVDLAPASTASLFSTLEEALCFYKQLADVQTVRNNPY